MKKRLLSEKSQGTLWAGIVREGMAISLAVGKRDKVELELAIQRMITISSYLN